MMLNVVKIFIISFVALYLIGNFNPYFETIDGYSHGLSAKQFSNGELFFTNDLIGAGIEFLPPDMMLTNDGKHLLYVGYAGFSGLTTASYIIGENFGLFYLGPITGILFLITIERFSTHFFGKYVGLLTLLFLSTSNLFYRSALNLQTESIFGIVFLLGCYFLIKFFKKQNINYILFSSTFFVIATLMRTNGIVYFPVELLLLSVFFIIGFKKPKILFRLSNSHEKLFSLKNFTKILFFTFIPWIILLIFWFSFYGYFFDDPLTNNGFEEKGTGETSGLISSIFSLETKNFENLKQYSKYLLPYQFPRIIDTTTIFSDITDLLGNNWLGVISLSLLSCFIALSVIMKKNRLILITFSVMIVGTGWFFGSITSEERALRGVPGRFMLPAFTLYSMILGMFIVSLLNCSYFKTQSGNFFKIIKVSFVLFLIIFFSFAFYFSTPSSAIQNNSFELKNPFQLAERYPLDNEGLTNHDVLIGYNFEAWDYGFIQFQPEISINDETISPDSINLLKQIMDENYEIYLLKNPTDNLDRKVYSILSKNPEFSFKEYSKSFCKLELIQPTKKIVGNTFC